MLLVGNAKTLTLLLLLFDDDEVDWGDDGLGDDVVEGGVSDIKAVNPRFGKNLGGEANEVITEENGEGNGFDDGDLVAHHRPWCFGNSCCGWLLVDWA